MSIAIVSEVGFSPRAPLLAEEGTNTVSAQLLRPLNEANADLKAQKYADAISKLKAAEAVKDKAPYDQHLINDFLTYAYVRTQDYASAAETMEAEVDDGLTPPADQVKKIRALAALHYQLKNYDKAIEYGRRAIKGGHGDELIQDELIQKVVGQAYYLKGDWKGALDFEEELVTRQIKRGETPAKESLQLFLSACVKLQDNDCERRALELLNGHYPGRWRPDLKAPPPPQWGTVMAFFFGGSEDLAGQKRPATAQGDNNEAK